MVSSSAKLKPSSIPSLKLAPIPEDALLPRQSVSFPDVEPHHIVSFKDSQIVVYGEQGWHSGTPYFVSSLDSDHSGQYTFYRGEFSAGHFECEVKETNFVLQREGNCYIGTTRIVGHTPKSILLDGDLTFQATAYLPRESYLLGALNANHYLVPNPTQQLQCGKPFNIFSSRELHQYFAGNNKLKNPVVLPVVQPGLMMGLTIPAQNYAGVWVKYSGHGENYNAFNIVAFDANNPATLSVPYCDVKVQEGFEYSNRFKKNVLLFRDALENPRFNLFTLPEIKDAKEVKAQQPTIQLMGWPYLIKQATIRSSDGVIFLSGEENIDQVAGAPSNKNHQIVAVDTSGFYVVSKTHSGTNMVLVGGNQLSFIEQKKMVTPAVTTESSSPTFKECSSTAGIQRQLVIVDPPAPRIAGMFHTDKFNVDLARCLTNIFNEIPGYVLPLIQMIINYARYPLITCKEVRLSDSIFTVTYHAQQKNEITAQPKPSSSLNLN